MDDGGVGVFLDEYEVELKRFGEKLGLGVGRDEAALEPGVRVVVGAAQRGDVGGGEVHFRVAARAREK